MLYYVNTQIINAFKVKELNYAFTAERFHFLLITMRHHWFFKISLNNCLYSFSSLIYWLYLVCSVYFLFTVTFPFIFFLFKFHQFSRLNAFLEHWLLFCFLMLQNNHFAKRALSHFLWTRAKRQYAPCFIKQMLFCKSKNILSLWCIKTNISDLYSHTR